MKTTLKNSASGILFRILSPLAVLTCLALTSGTARASIAYGSINNFDTVNDTSNVCHGFEIELDDLQTTDITYTYDYNHYGTPRITQYTTNDAIGLHTNVQVRYQAVWTNTGWSAYTAVPTTNIPPTQGHAFTNPSLNFGGEHFGLGYRKSPTKVYYYWLTNSGGSLLRGPQVNVSTPVFTASQAQAPVVAVIPAPVLPVPPPPLSDPTIIYEFSDATWVKVITTTSHTNIPVPLRNLTTPDTNNPSAKDWRNGEPDEVETEWQLLQTDYGAGYNPTNGVGGANGQLAGNGHSLTNGDDVVTYRYEYYAYVGPYADLDTHEALAQSVATNGTFHGTGIYSNTLVVGKFLGAQMSAMAVTPPIGLVDHLPDAELGHLYPTRCVVVAGVNTNFTATCSGLPADMSFDGAKGWIGNTPSQSGVFIVTVSVSSSNSPVLTKKYPLLVATGPNPPPHSSVDTSASPANGGTTAGDGVYTNGTAATVTATPAAGFKFVNWTDNGSVVSNAASSYTFTNIINRSLVANFVAVPQMAYYGSKTNTLIITWPTNFSGFLLQQNTGLAAPNWVNATNPISVVGTNYRATVFTTNARSFFRLHHP